jgi:hypothetical protein
MCKTTCGVQYIQPWYTNRIKLPPIFHLELYYHSPGIEFNLTAFDVTIICLNIELLRLLQFILGLKAVVVVVY